MRILLTVDPEIPVPPKNYGGIERIVDALITAFSKQGNEVYLIAHPDSTNQSTSRTFHWPAVRSRGLVEVVQNAFFLWQVTRRIKPAIIHSFSRLLYLYPVFISNQIPVVQTYQRAISNKSTKIASTLAGNKLQYTCCGSHMIKDHTLKSKFTPVHNFTDVDYFIPDNSKQPEHLFYLGRIEKIKGTKEAVEVALATKQKLIIAGNVQPGHEDYFEAYIKPYLDHPMINYVGPVNDLQKKTYLQSSKALLFPIQWDEPFGIVMAEAMSCGVPVIGFRKGAVPEVVTDEENGFIVDTLAGMIKAVNRLHLIDRNKVRERCVDHFSVEAISTEYLRIFTSTLA